MKLKKLAHISCKKNNPKDNPENCLKDDKCPTLYELEDSYIVQGNIADIEALQIDLGENETAVIVPKELLVSFKKISNDEYGALWLSFKTAFRYEGLPIYEMDEEDTEAIHAWKNGHDIPTFITNSSWQSRLRNWKLEGRSIKRVRLLDPPLTDYLRMGCEWWYPANIAAGEEVKGVVKSALKVIPEYDFWLFDDRTSIRMHYGETGQYLGAEKLSNERTNELVGQRDALLLASRDLKTVYDELIFV